MGEIAQLLFPQRCVGCSRSSGLLCRKCAGEWSKPIKKIVGGIELTSSAYYSLSISHIILKAKENNDSRSRLVLANAIASHIRESSLIVPIPSSSSAIRRRGFDHAFLLAKEVARVSGGHVWHPLHVIRRVKDQTQLTHQERLTNLAGSYALRSGNAPGEKIVLIDDLVTTGASLREAIRALHEAQIQPIQAISACIASYHLPNTISPSYYPVGP